ncbi:MAG: hypothetical protein U9R23_00600 [Candidatus Cloacimonadota bacterium]|nr:hypothetical protein [Candidatus Cloacimonadota bacterium]
MLRRSVPMYRDDISGKKYIICSLIILFACVILNAQEITQLTDIPTAGILQKGEVGFPISISKNEGVSFGAGVGIIPKLMFGIQYGGEYILGDSIPDWHSYPGVFVKYRIFDESPKMPAIAIGFDSRGYGSFIKTVIDSTDNDSTEVNRYEIKSKGFYVVASRNFNFLGNLGIHFGVNYSTERDDNDEDLNFFVGIDKSINPQISLLTGYDFAFNDNGKSGNDETYSFGEGNGYLNAALQLKCSEHIIIKIHFRDLLNNQYKNPDRAITIQYSTNL